MKQPIPFGKYFLLERVNVGGMAEVFKAKATGVEGFERLIAVKRILPGIAEDEEFVTMFKDEAKIAVQLTHANIAQIFDLGRADGSFYIALEYIHGKDLRAIMNRVRQRADQLPVAFACYVIMKVCEGLDYAHSKHDGAGNFLNLVHRDVSPQNVLVSYEGEVKIIDFGIAKAAGKAGKTQAGILKGKFGYMSPEQILGLEIDRRSDVFGVGICLYELLTGERLFAAETDFATLEKVRAGNILPPSSFNPRVPEELEQIVLRALAKDREARYQTAVALHDALQAFLHTSGSVFGRKDLALYMHRVFTDEIEKENARDAEYARLDAPADAAHNDLESDDDDVDVSPRAYAPTVKVTSKAHAAADVRKRTGTLLGVPVAASRLPTVPRPIPNPASIPPLAGGSPGSRPPEPSRPSLQAVAPELSHAMDWDDEELSTQIYDKPELDAAIAEAEAADALEAEGLDAMQPSLPDSVESDAGLAAARYAGRQKVYPARTSDPGPQPLRLAPPPAAVPREQAALASDEPAPPTRGRPMLAAVVTVLAIIGLIVLGLAAFRSRDPGTVSLSTRPSRVEVSVDGRALGSSMSPFVIGELTPDRPHEIVVSSAGHAPWTKTLTLAPGQLMTLTDVVLEPIETGFVIVTEPPEATISLDEKVLPGRSPLRIADLAPGEHRIRVELQGYASWESTLNAAKGTVLPLPTIHLSALPSPAPVNEPSARVNRRAAATSERERSAAQTERASAAVSSLKPAAAQPAPEPEDTADEEEADSEPERRAEAEPEIKNPYRTETEQAAKAVPASPAQPTGKLRVNSRPWSQIFIDGKAYGATPKLNIELPVGTHNLRLVNDEFKIEKVEQVVVAEGETRNVIVNLMDQ